MSRESFHIGVLGADTTGKTALCEAMVEAAPQVVDFSGTDRWVHSWLRTHGLGRPSAVIRPGQVDTRERVFLAANRVRAHALAAVRDGSVAAERHPVVSVRGLPDTLITHQVLRRVLLGDDTPISFNADQLFPEPHRPDVLVILTAPLATMIERLEERGQTPTGGNSPEFLGGCQESYLEIINADPDFPVLVFDTSQQRNSPAYIADMALGAVA